MRAIMWCGFLVAGLVGCVGDAPDDQDDEGAVDITTTAAEVSTTAPHPLVGSYEQVGTPAEGDLPFLALAKGGSYVRVRCYHAGCTTRVPETDNYVLIKYQDGRTFVRFQRFAWTDFANRVSKQVAVDTYEYKITSTGLRLRKTYTSRWITLALRTHEALCNTSGGTWTPGAELQGAAAGTTTQCDCGQNANTFPSPAFVPGEGGCIMALGTGEDDCDSTRGRYTDDDTDRLGDYCLCPAGTRPTDSGCKPI